MKSSIPVDAAIALVTAATLLVSVGCDHSSTSGPSTSATTVPATDPGREAYTRLTQIEQRRPDHIPAALRADFPWAFDPATGKLVEYQDALVRARAANQDCRAACVGTSYIEMLARTNAGG